MSLRIAIIEDEPATARNLQFLLQEIDPEIRVLTTLGSVAESVAWLGANRERCDLLFMDIRLNDGLSFDIFEKVAVEAPVIFVTAYHDYALQAFKAGGIDYILKPFDEQELAQAITKFKRLTGMHPVAIDRIREISQHLRRSGGGFKESFLVHFRDKLVPLRAEDIAWFYTSQEVVHAQTFDGRPYIVDFTLEQLQEQLDPGKFFRVNRQFIIQRKAIVEVNFYFNGRLLVKASPAAEEKMLVSKARVPEFKAWMNV
ncbi:MAG TPA: LytTR family DNA-binding domain-containing protein [Puia sp.]|nr:LytTR family DNA-binding domain-containing protein [Puia sp.]